MKIMFKNQANHNNADKYVLRGQSVFNTIKYFLCLERVEEGGGKSIKCLYDAIFLNALPMETILDCSICLVSELYRVYFSFHYPFLEHPQGKNVLFSVDRYEIQTDLIKY